MLSNAGQLKKKNVKKICTISILRFFFSCPAGIQFSDPDVTGGVESKMLTVFLLMVFFNYLCVQNFGIYTTRKVLLEIFPTLLSTPKYFTYLHRILKLYCCWAELKVEDFFL